LFSSSKARSNGGLEGEWVMVWIGSSFVSPTHPPLRISSGDIKICIKIIRIVEKVVRNELLLIRKVVRSVLSDDQDRFNFHVHHSDLILKFHEVERRSLHEKSEKATFVDYEFEK
jgi:hypothetical protein